jgi:hypothetical protein
MSPAVARALAQACELQLLLQDIEENDSSPPIENAIDGMDNVIGELDRLLPDAARGQRSHGLRLLVTEPAQFEQHRLAQAMRRLSTTPWRKRS